MEFPFTKTAFWDVDTREIDLKEMKLFVMKRVLQYGLWEDIRALIKYYGFSEISKEAGHIKGLDKKSQNFVEIIFKDENPY